LSVDRSGSDLNKVRSDLPGLGVAHDTSCVGNHNQVTQRVNILVAAGHLVAVTVLVHGHVGLLVIVGHLVVEAVLWILVECLAISSGSDLSNLVGGRIAEADGGLLGGSKAEGGTQEQYTV